MISTEKQVGERFLQLITALGHTKKTFSVKMGKNLSGLSHVVNGRNYPSTPLLMLLMHHYPEVNIRRLYTGEGPILLNSDTPHTEFEYTIRELKGINEKLDKLL